jgi:hypothetical protein
MAAGEGWSSRIALHPALAITGDVRGGHVAHAVLVKG